ncbi:hypothetical protein [Dictyobacter aurantiacus]|uniref:Uncharacterized protein n=1 Tax=Dictyobacter aurantiacus TaxID=1936993 RepID=A0A401ZT52_9CHLR|nr:hypothetical protein [Dictyobacter aurantiacus]GCE10069.1 hypothetical protein KDAU_73980 [Dictyobacter aurantiacus]
MTSEALKAIRDYFIHVMLAEDMLFERWTMLSALARETKPVRIGQSWPIIATAIPGY